MYEFTGSLSNIAISYATGKPVLSVEVNEDKSSLSQVFEKLRDIGMLKIKIGKVTKNRSLDANAYYWLLLSKLSKALNISNPHCHNLMLRRYGVLEEFDGQIVYWVIPDTEEASRKAEEAEEYHIKPTSQVREGNDGKMYRTYILLKGSHSFTKQEFRDLLEGLVDECKHCGIETKSEEEVASLLRECGR